MSEKNLEKTIGAPTNAQIKAIEKMEQGLKSGKKYKPQEAKSLLNQAGYELIPTKGDHMKILRGDKPVRNLPTNPRPNSFTELDMRSKSHNPKKVLKTIVYDFKNRQFKDYYFD